MKTTTERINEILKEYQSEKLSIEILKLELEALVLQAQIEQNQSLINKI